MKRFSQGENQIFLFGLVFALLLSVFSSFFVFSFYELLKLKGFHTFGTYRVIIVASAVALAFLFHWFFRRIRGL